MIVTFRKSISTIPKNIFLKNTFLSHCSLRSRNFCSKDENDGKKFKAESSITEESKIESGTQPEKSEQLQSDASNALKEAAKLKLHSLVSDIMKLSDESSKNKSSLNLATAIKRPTKKERLKKMKAELKPPKQEMDLAIKAVATTFNDNSEKVESELKQKLKSMKTVDEPTSEAEKEESLIDSEVNQNLMSSVEEVADTISESPIPPRSELAKRLLRLSLDQKESSEHRKSVKSLIKDMTVEEKTPLSLKKSILMKQREKLQPRLKSQTINRINLFDGASLGIFALDAVPKPDSRNVLWEKLQENEMQRMTQFAPANAFEEMIMWTEQGKHWKFPIDNETEMGEEENIGFHEHVFLEQHLKGFPTRGPIRQFMELVVVGLSKNSYMPVDRKISHIDWFREYFEEKREILKDVGAIDN